MLNMKRLLAYLALAGVSTVGLAGCVVRETRGAYYTGSHHGRTYTRASVAVGYQGQVYVNNYPPEPIYETIPSAPSYGYVWIDGRWDAHRPGYTWNDGYWDRRGNSHVWVRGSWRAGGHGHVRGNGHHHRGRGRVQDHRR